jgi:hypothetical protein
MRYPKKLPVFDKDNVRVIRSCRCLACGANPPNDADHLKTRGAGGGDELTNLIPLCRCHHAQRHRIGLRNFVRKWLIPIEFTPKGPKRCDL